MKTTLYGILLWWLTTLTSCEHKEAVEQPSFTPYEWHLPARFPSVTVPADNAMSVERVALGRQLYYDTILSNDGRACASCHWQVKGFTSDFFSSTPVLPHVNLAWSRNFLWRGEKSGSLEDMMKYEVNDFFQTDITKLNASKPYRDLFLKAYGTTEITTDQVAYALAQFIRTQVSGNSRFDQYRRGELMLSPAERDGMITFFTEKGDCFHCHNEIFLTDNSFHNTGMDSVFAAGEKGLYEVTGLPEDIGKYRTPTLRNCELRSRFMHDGRFQSLEEVIEFYNSGVNQNSPNIDPLMTLPYKATGLHLTQAEKDNLLAFLKTLTDTTFTSNPDLSRP